MSNDVALPKAFQEKISERLRGDIGELLPKEVIDEMTSRTIKELFFEGRVVEVQKNGYGGTIKKQVHSWFDEEIIKVFKPLMETEVKKYIENNSQELIKQTTKALTEKSPQLIAEFMIEMFKGAASQIKYNTINDIQSGRY